MTSCPATIVIADERTWPRDVLRGLAAHDRTFRAWEGRRTGRGLRGVSGADYDHAHHELWEILSRHMLRGYHCTRLTNTEVETIRAEGMSPLSGEGLMRRIALAKSSGLIPPTIATRLLAVHQADDWNRRGMIWFCFYAPRRTSQPAVERFFRNWGGESLYNSHENDEELGPFLQRVGTPCVVEADVPIRSLEKHGGLVDVIARNYLVRRGVKTAEPLVHDNRAKETVPATNIRRVIQFPTTAFVNLTRCDRWSPPLL